MIAVLVYIGTPETRGLRHVVDAFPRDFDAAVFVFGSVAAGDLVPSLKSVVRLSLRAEPRPQPLEAGALYVAPRDHHLHVDAHSVHFIPAKSNVPDHASRLIESVGTCFGRWTVGVVIDAADLTASSLCAGISGAGGHVVSLSTGAGPGVRAAGDASAVGRRVVATVEEMRNRLPRHALRDSKRIASRSRW